MERLKELIETLRRKTLSKEEVLRLLPLLMIATLATTTVMTLMLKAGLAHLVGAA